MANKIVNPNAKEALNQTKMEIANEISGETNIMNDNNKVDSIGISARVGGLMSRELIAMGEKELMKIYNQNKK